MWFYIEKIVSEHDSRVRVGDVRGRAREALGRDRILEIVTQDDVVGLEPEREHLGLLKPIGEIVELELEELPVGHVQLEETRELAAAQIQLARHFRALEHVGQKLTIDFLVFVK